MSTVIAITLIALLADLVFEQTFGKFAHIAVVAGILLGFWQQR